MHAGHIIKLSVHKNLIQSCTDDDDDYDDDDDDDNNNNNNNNTECNQSDLKL